MSKRDALAARPDGRLYSRPTRRCVAILNNIAPSRRFELIELARELHKKGLREFSRNDGRILVPISVERIRDYIGHLHALGLIVEADKRFGLVAAFRKPSSDPEWAQYLSDVARKHLADILNIKAGDLPKRFETEIREMHGQEKVPTLSAVMGALGIEGTRREELFRWSLFLYTDGDACPIEIHRYPHIAPKA